LVRRGKRKDVLPEKDNEGDKLAKEELQEKILPFPRGGNYMNTSTFHVE
jgi:hypothetical protein